MSPSLRAGTFADLYHPDGKTLVNKLGIVNDARALQAIEGEYGDARTLQLFEGVLERSHDVQHLRAIHRHLFADVYEWAGVMRHEPITLGADRFILPEGMQKVGAHTAFARASTIPDRLDGLFGRLRDDNYFRGQDRETFVRSISGFLVELNEIHPFPEGNGRSQREIARSIAEGAGHSLDFSIVSQERMAAVSERSMAADSRPADPAAMIRLIDEISDPVRAAPLRKAISFLRSQDFPWLDQYISTSVPGEIYQGTMVDRAGANFMMRRADDTIIIGFTADLDGAPRSGDPIRFVAQEGSYHAAVAHAFGTLDRAVAARHPALAAAHRTMDLVEQEITREFAPGDPDRLKARELGHDMILDDLRHGRSHSRTLHIRAVEQSISHEVGLSL